MYKECREGQILDVGDRILTYGEGSAIDRDLPRVDGRLCLPRYVEVTASMIIRATTAYVWDEDGRKYPRVYKKEFRRCAWKKVKLPGIIVKAFSVK